MKRLHWFLGMTLLALLLGACNKELTSDVVTGRFQKDGAGNCAPIAVNGIYRVDSVLTSDHYVDVQLTADNIGAFDIKSDTINGFSFSKSGTVGSGLNTIRLYASGKPTAAGTSTFTIQFGTSVCTFDITVFGTTTGAAIYTLGGAGSNCTGFTLGGTYQAGTTTDNTNFVNFVVNVTTLGTYNVTTNSLNGITFSGSGVFTTTGTQGVTLTATGTPMAEGDFNYTATVPTGNCSFIVHTNAPGPGTSAYTLGGSPGNCTGAVLAGTYIQGVPLTAANTVTVSATVTALGSYNLTTAPVNGVTYAGSGNFTTLGPQMITLTGNGTPAAAGAFNHVISSGTGSTSCTFSVNYNPPAPPASFTLQGSPGSCSGAVLAGSYYTGNPLGASNTVSLQVNVTTAGAYTITTNSVNGISFSKTGIFAGTGVQTVVLNGTGTPASVGTNNYTANNGSGSTCTFSVPVTAPPAAAYTINCGAITVNGTYTVGTALTAGNTVSVGVNVTSTGTYTLTTTQGGMTFSKSGVFGTTGVQTVILNGSGNPTTAGTNSFTLGSCNFDVTVGTTPPPTDLKWEFTVGATKYEGDCESFEISAGQLNIFSTSGGNLSLDLNNASGNISTGSYSGTSTAGKYVNFTYNTTQFFSLAGSGLTNLTATVTTYDTVNGIIQGTFSGTVINLSAVTFTVTNGKFKAQL